MMSIRQFALLAVVGVLGSFVQEHIGNVEAFSIDTVTTKTTYPKQQQLRSNEPNRKRKNTISSGSLIARQAATSTEAQNVVDEKPTIDNEIADKQKLFGLLRAKAYIDPVLADPITKEDLVITTKGVYLGDSGSRTSYNFQSSTNQYTGSSATFFNLLEPIPTPTEDDTPSNEAFLRDVSKAIVRGIVPFVPPPIRTAVANLPFLPKDDDGSTLYIPMRDLFTSPAVSFAYERGWRQGFARAGFPGPDKEAAMAMDYFVPSMVRYNTTKTLVDMSCATGLFTRRFIKSQKYKRVLGCDYSASMLQQARQFINTDNEILSSATTQFDLVQLDVGQIPMKDNSVDAIHAGAAMHCWPDLPKAVSELYRVLKPGGRYFATTFLSSYFSVLRGADGSIGGDNIPVSQQAFQYFTSVDQLRSLLVAGGFPEENVSVEVIAPACVVIRCEK